LNIRYNIDPDTQQPHIHGHRVFESEVEDVLRFPLESRRGGNDSTVLLGRTRSGRLLRVIVAFDADRTGVFVITAYDLQGKPLKALRRRLRKRGLL
jgi:hypothetical protein